MNLEDSGVIFHSLETSPASVASASTVSNRRNAVYVKEVTPEATKSKPPLPSASTCNNMTNSGNLEAVASGQVPKPPPRSRPKSWTSTLFNAMRNNHRSVTFQCVDEEETHLRISTENMLLPGSNTGPSQQEMFRPDLFPVIKTNVHLWLCICIIAEDYYITDIQIFGLVSILFLCFLFSFCLIASFNVTIHVCVEPSARTFVSDHFSRYMRWNTI